MCIKMSDVRLSNASPTLERVDARQQDNPRPSVRRNLYGKPDPGEIQRNLAAVVQEEVQAFREKYNFDPLTERPLSPRNYDWQEDRNPPEFYLRAAHGNQQPQRDGDSPGGSQQDEAAGNSERQQDHQPARDRSRKRQQGTLGPCSDQCQSKRSHTDDDDDENQPDGAGSQAVTAAEETPSSPESRAEEQ
ncbi:cyclin-dependent kinase inhibitor 1Ba [Solea solea]|uniref:cyclin-dependent kinase inhibitor 1Ba n=1 Tax=Solea solea TaxID=90069 RepID=UPI00272C7B0E|nr:cyclin-dependent kinase inhibitor 1Ba [Solea solea]